MSIHDFVWKANKTSKSMFPLETKIRYAYEFYGVNNKELPQILESRERFSYKAFWTLRKNFTLHLKTDTFVVLF